MTQLSPESLAGRADRAPGPDRVRPDVVGRIVWLLEHGADEDDQSSPWLWLPGPSEAEFDAALTFAVLRGVETLSEIEARLVHLARLIR